MTQLATHAEIIELFKLDNNVVDGLDSELDETIVNTVASYTIAQRYISVLLSVNFGAAVYSVLGFKTTNMAYTGMTLLLAVVHWTFNLGCSPLRERQEEKDKMERLNQISKQDVSV